LAATVLKRLHHDPQPPEHWAEVSRRVDAVVMQALSRNPQDWFVDPDAMAVALRSAARQGAAVTSATPTGMAAPSGTRGVMAVRQPVILGL
jgi:hypothetical protein